MAIFRNVASRFAAEVLRILRGHEYRQTRMFAGKQHEALVTDRQRLCEPVAEGSCGLRWVSISGSDAFQ